MLRFFLPFQIKKQAIVGRYYSLCHFGIQLLYFEFMEISNEEGKLKENKPDEEEQELIADFSQMFKSKVNVKKPPKLGGRQPENTPKWQLQIPVKLELTKQQMCQRKVLDQKRWMSMVKADLEQHRIVAAVASSWNFLFSTKGYGELPPLTVKKAVQLLDANSVKYVQNIQEELSGIVFKCFSQICQEFKIQAQSNIFYKPVFPQKTDKNEAQALDSLFTGLKNNNSAYILITYKNILCPIGFDITPLVPLDAYKKLQEIKPENTQLWIINGSTQRNEGPFVSKRWKHIKESLQTVWPLFVNLEQPKKGSIRRPEATAQNQSEARGCQFCLLQFKKTS